MAISANATVTGVTGPAKSLTATVFNSVRRLDFKISDTILSITKSDGEVVDIELTAIATVTYSISGTVATVTIST